MIFRPAYEKYGLNSAKPEFFGRLRLSKFAPGYSRLKFAAVIERGARYATPRTTRL